MNQSFLHGKHLSEWQGDVNSAGALGEVAAKVEQQSLLESGRIPSLDGLRAISIAMVLAFHAVNAAVRPVLGHDYDGPWRVICNGALGVSVFFTISGFLITLLLVREIRKTGRISLMNFYIRRAFRIWPAFYFYLLIVVVLALHGWIAIGRRNVLAAGLFVFNYVPHVGTWWVSHSWSLSVEEQFYLFWPALLALVGRRRAVLAAVLIIAIVPAIRAVEILTLPANSEFIVRMWEMAHTRLDSLMFGCAAALLYGNPRFERGLNAVFRFGGHWIALIYLFGVAPLISGWHLHLFQIVLGYSLESASVSLLMLWSVQHFRSLPGRVLNSRVFVHVGLISYSLYLWQQMFLASVNRSWTGRLPLNLVCAFIAAEISFFGIERPFLWLRSRIVGTGIS